MSVGAIGSYSFMDRMVTSAMNRSTKTQGKAFDLSQLASDIVKKDDSNGDGLLSASETKLSSDVFKKMDADSNGSLTTDELLSGLEQNNKMRPMGPPPDASQLASKIMQTNDSNGDGVLSASESKLSSDVFKTLDTNGDSSVTTDELLSALQQDNKMKPMGPPPDSSKLASSIMQDEDSNGDGILSASETDLSTDEFNVLDTNRDGKVSMDELLAGVKARESERAQQQGTASTSNVNLLQSLLDTLAQNDASKAYGGANSLSQMFQSSAVQKLTVTA